MKKIRGLHKYFLGAVLLASSSAQAQFKLQLLHSSDMEAGVAAIKNAPHFAAIVDSLENVYPNTIRLSGGDNFIPSPFLNASTDLSVRTPIQLANASIFKDVTNTSKFRENYARVDISLMHAIGFEASAVGNHEFDLGTSVLSDAVRVETSGTELRWAGQQFPYLSCNLDFSADPALSALYTSSIRPNTDYKSTPSVAAAAATFKRKIAPATFITVNGEKIGIVGATTQILESISSVGGVRVKGAKADNMTLLATYIQPYIDTLITVNGCNKIILLSHLQQIALEKELVGKLTGVDIIVAAGSHTLQADATDILRAGDVKKDEYPTVTKTKNNEDALIVCTDGEWKYMGRLVVDFDANGKLILSSLNPAINGAYAADSLGVVRVWGDYTKAFAAGTKGQICRDLTKSIGDVIVIQDGTIFGKTAVFMEGRRNLVRTEETNFGSVTAEANLWYAKKIDPTVKVSIKNGGGIRSAIGEVKVDGATNQLQLLPPQANPIANKKTGDISLLDILNSLRFNNGLTLVSVTATQLLQTMNHAVSAWTATATPGQFPQVSGMRFRFDPKLPARTRVTEIMLCDSLNNITDVVVQRGKVVGDANRLIRVVSLNFLVDVSGAGPNGGDGYPFNTFVNASPATANKVLLTKLPADPKTGAATFAADGSEQDAFAEYINVAYKNTAFNKMETAAKADERIQNLNLQSDFFTNNENKVIYTTNTGVKVYNGGYGSDMAMVPGKMDEFYFLTDRGSNADSAATGSTKIFSNPDFAPQIGKFKLRGDSLAFLGKIELKRNDGTKLTGLPNPVGAGNTGERARNLSGDLLPNDAEGLDSEGLVAMADGTFWVSDEYGPHMVHFDATGKTIERINPFGTGFGGKKMPIVFAKRRASRGMEGLTITPDGKKLVGIMQSTMHNPTNSGLNSKTTRILVYEIATGKSNQYIYRQDKNNNSNSGISCISDTTYLVLERDGDSQGGTPAAVYKRFYKININGATDISDATDGATGKLYNAKTIEQLTDAELTTAGIAPVSKVLVSDLLTDIPFYPHDKLEGMSILNDSTLLVCNDDDFSVNSDQAGGYTQKLMPLNGKRDIGTLYFVKLKSKLTNLGTITATENTASKEESDALRVSPNPTEQVVYFSKTIRNGVLVDVLGNTLMTFTDRDDLDLSTLPKGLYFLISDKESVKIMLK